MKSIVIGVGNTLFKDDGIGVYTACFLKNNYAFSPHLEILDGGTMGLNLIGYFQAYDQVIILDTLSIDDEPGRVYRIPAEEFHGLGAQRNTAHEVEIIQMLEAGALYGLTAKVTILGIVPEDITSVSIGLSASLEKQFPGYLQLVLDEIASLGIEAIRTKESSLERVVTEVMGSTDR
ncbi:MAG: HyaD/HybD family hydrogenase maturation endopeptidase [Campylobacterales bacterium]|nr:HyaD/HybD family hydrogenase maturation endopeptidase [Campylobacterales bacterium]